MFSLTFRNGLLAPLPYLASSGLSVAISAALFARDMAVDVVETVALLAIVFAVRKIVS